MLEKVNLRSPKPVVVAVSSFPSIDVVLNFVDVVHSFSVPVDKSSLSLLPHQTVSLDSNSYLV